jgi:hypothetical protein
LGAPHFLVLTFTDNFYGAISLLTFTDGLLRDCPVRATHADEHRVGYVYRKRVGWRWWHLVRITDIYISFPSPVLALAFVEPLVHARAGNARW